MCERDRFLRKISRSSGKSLGSICEDDSIGDISNGDDDDGFSGLFMLKIKSGAALELATREPRLNVLIAGSGGASNGRTFELIS